MNYRWIVLLAALALSPLARAQSIPAPLPGVAVDHGWIRASNKIGITANGYFTLTNTANQPDQLIAAQCPVARKTEMVSADGTTLTKLTIPAHGTLVLDLKSAHLRLIGTRFRLYHTATIPCGLTFSATGSVMLYLHVERPDATRFLAMRKP
jgi:copper(I)-binding protein